MTTPDKHATDDEKNEAEAIPAYGRVWQRWDPAQGSSNLSLKAVAVLYDAARPLTADELVERLLPQLDAYARSYLEAWWLRKRDQVRAGRVRAQKRRSLGKDATSDLRSAKPRLTLTPAVALRAWLMAVFRQRATKGGQSLIYKQGHFQPGARPPRALRLDGTLVEYTPEERRDMEQSEHDQGRTYRALLEWKHGISQLDLTTVEARSHLLMFLIRRFNIGADDPKLPLDERRLSAVFKPVFTLADTLAVKRAVLQQALDAIWPITSTTPEE